VPFTSSVWDVPPGQRNARYHYDHADEEWLLILEGRPTVCHPGGEQVLEPGDVVCFPAGPGGAHSVANLTSAMSFGSNAVQRDRNSPKPLGRERE